ncbi:MAG: ABC transporter ATP-binding protein [Ruminococcus sp.]|jgi:ABC-type nitrate/sulfonate/bicarbonate transport system ATPase subunit|nr:ABC transporter ATP-binding protein [Ruminococcus sp.]
MSKLEIKNVSFSYDGKTDIIKDINLSVEKGELISILGKSGCGKTTLFNVISGLKRPKTGSVIIDGEDVTGKPGHISYMLQKDLLLPYRTIEDNVALPLILSGTKKKAARQAVQDGIRRFGLDGTQKKYPGELSGGMRQRAALLRTYNFSGEIALLDEPFSALDTLTKGEMHSWFLDVMSEIKLSALFITHDIDEAIFLSDKICLLTGKPSSITDIIEIKRPESHKKDFSLTPEFLEYKKTITEKLFVENTADMC